MRSCAPLEGKWERTTAIRWRRDAAAVLILAIAIHGNIHQRDVVNEASEGRNLVGNSAVLSAMCGTCTDVTIDGSQFIITPTANGAGKWQGRCKATS
jgi:hypothetical protein